MTHFQRLALTLIPCMLVACADQQPVDRDDRGKTLGGLNGGGGSCDPDLECAEILSCYDDKLFPTACGPDNCDEPIGDCNEGVCDPDLVCGEALTCVEGKLYPTTCGPDNCDEPIGDCNEGVCDPDLVCGEALTCVEGKLYPTTCGPDNCDEPIGDCD